MKTNWKLFLVLLAALLRQTANGNLVGDGSFELVDIAGHGNSWPLAGMYGRQGGTLQLLEANGSNDPWTLNSPAGQDGWAAVSSNSTGYCDWIGYQWENGSQGVVLHNGGGISQSVTVVNGETYNYTFYAAGRGGSVGMTLTLGSQIITNVIVPSGLTAGGGFTAVSGSFIAGSGGIQPLTFNIDTNVEGYLDNVQMNNGPPPVTTNTSTLIGSSVNPSSNDQAVMFTATVTPVQGGPPTGTVTFSVDGVAQATVNVSTSGTNATASYGNSSLSAIGSPHTVTANYNGDANFGSSSDSLSQTVLTVADGSYLDNGVIRIGVDLTKGGSITYLSLSGTTNNIVNDHDFGREIQQSYYAGPQPYNPSNNINPNWPWNPIQVGDSYGNPALLLASTNDGRTLYVKCRPMQWALDNVPGQCTLESWISLTGNVAIVSNRLINLRTDTARQFSAMNQELPAVYTIGTLYRLFSYAGEAPFTGDAVTNLPVTAIPPGIYWQATESWAALVNATNWGLGVYHPGAIQFVAGFAGTPGSGGPNDDNTGYIAPVYTEVLDTNIVYTYTYHLILDTLANIRAWVYSQPYRPACNFVFKSDRQHWMYVLASDSGWPITNCLHESLDSDDPQTWSPLCAFYATNVPTLYIRAAYQIANPAGRAFAQVFWATNAGGFSQAASVVFPVVVDGQYHTYALNLAASNNYSGLITQLRFDPAYNGQTNDFVNIAAISSSPFAGNDAVLPMLNIAQNNGTVVTSFPAVSGTNAGFIDQNLIYDLEGSSNLGTGVWQGIPDYTNLTGNGQRVLFTNSSGAASGFYRVGVRVE